MARCDYLRDDPETGIQQDIVEQLGEYIETRDIVVLVDIEGVNILVEMLCHSKVIKDTSKKLAIISCANYPVKIGNHEYLTVSEMEMGKLLNIYRCYEPSDKLVLLTDSRNYGSTWNYVSNGIMSAEDVFESILA